MIFPVLVKSYYNPIALTARFIKVRGKSPRCPASHGNPSVMVIFRERIIENHMKRNNPHRQVVIMKKNDLVYLKTKEQRIYGSNWKLSESQNKKIQ